MKKITILIALVCTIGASCTTRTASVATGPITSEQAKSIQHTSHAVSLFVQDKSFATWRKAVADRTYDLVNAGNTNLSQIKLIVYEQTRDEESQARKQRLAFAEAMHSLLAQSEKELSGDRLKKLTEEFETQTKETLHQMTERSFTESRDKVIEQYYWEAIKQISQQPAAHVQSEGAPSD